ncbi:hypothetical protein PQD73_gp050 [Stenotrophomonas phage Salva]|uniref:Uncharacterized protein n=1 Tax=Stenotrophomonas phage Salva TaxID=2801524 RepID=A0A8B6Q859_9CAUD|nr:hypothetical protein PQD73_gp050 [Stenotrophomonas phage Salva]QQM18214.1 hypothetical protein CPT_Salva_050 [Stenotrophomonas phage Salva]
MATLPESAIMLIDNYDEKLQPSVLRTQMDRSYPVQRIINSRCIIEVKCTLYFKRDTDHEEFMAWYMSTIGRVGFFDFVHPGTKKLIQNARFKEGDIGSKTPTSSAWFSFMRTVTIEYLQGA